MSYGPTGNALARWTRNYAAAHPATIYMITHIATGRAYVGMTRGPLQRRWRGHVSAARRPKTPIQQAIHDHGAEAFSLEVISVVAYAEGNRRERAEMMSRNTFLPNGYNVWHPGRPVRALETAVEQMIAEDA